MDTTLQQFLTHTFTTTAAHRRLRVLRDIIDAARYQADTTTTIADRVAAEIAALADEDDRVALRALGTQWLTSGEAATAAVGQLVTDVEALPTMVVYVPVELTAAARAMLGQWCRAEISEPLLLELHVDKAVVGGCGFIHNDHYHDYSLTAALQQQPAFISKLVRSYE